MHWRAGRGSSLGLGERSPNSRDFEGEGGEGFYIAENGRRLDLLASQGGMDKPPRPPSLLTTYLAKLRSIFARNKTMHN
jgi:hypothetical protein